MEILYVTSTRAEYGIMEKLLEMLSVNNQLDLVVTGTHLNEKYGKTKKYINYELYNNVYEVEMNQEDSSNKQIVKSISKLQKGLIPIMEKGYDMVLILGDRFEMVPVAQIANIYNIRVCHLHGGEKTLGNYDDNFRHAITKMSHLHLASCSTYARRIIQLGEENVYNVGSLGVKNALNNVEVSNKTNLPFNEKSYFVVLFHPETVSGTDVTDDTENIVSVIKKLQNDNFVIIGPNSDTKSEVISNAFSKLKLMENVVYNASYSTEEYHQLLKGSLGLIGNSSSGIIEAPSLKIPTLNIGARQEGRIMGNSIINVECNKQSILNGIEKLKNFDEEIINPYENKISIDKICRIIEEANVKVQKDFKDMK